MITLTKEWLQKTIAELEEERDATPGAVNEDAANALAAMKLALASLEAEPVAWLLSGGGAKNNVSFDSGNAYADPLREVTPLYTAPPAPVSVPAGYRLQPISEYDAMCAAMLQGAELVTADNKLPFEQWLSQQTGTIDVECGCVMTEVFFHWLRVAYEAGSSPIVPDGWVACSELMPEVGVKVLCFPVNDEPIHATYNGQVWLQDISWSASDEPIDNVISCNVFHWMPLPAAPQQEKNNEK